MALTLQTLEAPIADFLIAALESHKAEALALIANFEGGAVGVVTNALKNSTRPGGLLGVVFPAIESEIETLAKQLVAQYGPEVVFAFIDAEAHLFAKSVGG
jgi:hypothetical protein